MSRTPGPARRLPRPDRSPTGVAGRGVLLAAGLVLGIVTVLLWWPRPIPRTDRGVSADGTRSSSGAPNPTASAGPPVAILESETNVFARYAGSAACRDCHTNAYARWSASHHALAERAPSVSLDGAAFEPAREFPHGSQTTRVAVAEGGFTIASTGLGGDRKPAVVGRVIGESPLRQYLVAAPGGRWQAMEAAWDPRTNDWFNVYGREDRQPGEWGHWTGRGMNWNSMCGTCHNTRFRKNYDAPTDGYRTAMAEVSVGCEACHGPSADHVRWQRAWQGTGKTDPTLRKTTPAVQMEACAPCHARRSELTGEVLPGASFWDHYLLAIVDETDTFYPDGQIREEDYEYSAFLGSRMHAAGVTCLDCHEPHDARPRLAGNDLCLRCHNGSRVGSPLIDPARHTFHAPGSTGSLCVNCHMPQTPYMQRHWRHDHGFTSPDPVLSKEWNIPNACNRCHTDKDVEWSIRAAREWYGARLERPARRRTRVLAAARRGDEGSVDGLLGLLNSPETPYWQAATVALLERWIDRPTVVAGVSRKLEHEHPLVRYRAVQALAPLAEAGEGGVGGGEAVARLRARLTDPARAVRFVAAWALREEVDPESPAGRELAHVLALNADQPTGRAQMASLALSRRQPGAAVEALSRAVAWDPGSPVFRHDYAVALSLVGRSREALEQVRETVRLEPGVAENHYRLGLAASEAGDMAGALAALEQAVRLDPRHARAWYNLGLARDAEGRRAGALEALERAERITPRDPRIPYARATLLARESRWTEAREAARRALQLEPGFPAATELLRVLPSD